ncbi:hypothetical protein JXA27_06845 [Aerococcaceae bacterium zg-B36]|uniref:hypothetical protein n=1 Tax=Aerococcaceae bacterium zg-252 TaxID=2796928 RepID=UPI001BD8EF5D|nr:hypothetical protein [Aerococcaceae bacterium zg-B36]
MMVQYKDILPREVLELFGNKRDEIECLELPQGSFEIDLEKIVEILGLKIEYSDSPTITENTILVESNWRQGIERYQIAREIGRYLWNKKFFT